MPYAAHVRAFVVSRHIGCATVVLGSPAVAALLGRFLPLTRRRLRVPHPAGAGPLGHMPASTPWKRWYNTSRWRALRLKIFLRDLFTCQMAGCSRLEGDTSKLVCDHVKPHRGNEALFWDEANLQTLCKPCHDKAKQREEQATLHMRGVWD
jgi:5-methylcytosine-specific restriction protein A